MARNYAALLWEYKREMSALNDAEFGRLCRALLEYSESGTPIALCGNERFFAERVMMQEDRFKESYTTKAEKNRENGVKGGRPKKTEKNPKKPNLTQKTETETKTDTISPNGENKSPLSSPQGERFDRFWALYPNKTGKKKARESWEKLKPSEELTETILNAVSKQKLWPKWQKDGGQYIPNPATWLNQGRWEDEPPEGGEDPYAKFT